MKNFTGLDKFVLETLRKSLASKGYEFTHFQIYEQIKNVKDLNSRFNHTQYGLYQLWSKYNFDPPKPPYKYYFETQKEAECFAKRAKNKYNVNCDIDLVDFRKWKLTTKKKRKKLVN